MGLIGTRLMLSGSGRLAGVGKVGDRIITTALRDQKLFRRKDEQEPCALTGGLIQIIEYRSENIFVIYRRSSPLR